MVIQRSLRWFYLKCFACGWDRALPGNPPVACCNSSRYGGGTRTCRDHLAGTPLSLPRKARSRPGDPQETPLFSRNGLRRTVRTRILALAMNSETVGFFEHRARSLYNSSLSSETFLSMSAGAVAPTFFSLVQPTAFSRSVRIGWL